MFEASARRFLDQLASVACSQRWCRPLGASPRNTASFGFNGVLKPQALLKTRMYLSEAELKSQCKDAFERNRLCSCRALQDCLSCSRTVDTKVVHHLSIRL